MRDATSNTTRKGETMFGPVVFETAAPMFKVLVDDGQRAVICTVPPQDMIDGPDGHGVWSYTGRHSVRDDECPAWEYEDVESGALAWRCEDGTWVL